MMCLVLLQRFKNKTTVKISDSQDKLIRETDLILGNEYIINPINPRIYKNRGRRVVFKGLKSSSYGTVAIIKYLDTLRPGIAELENIDVIPSAPLERLEKDTDYTDAAYFKEPIYQQFSHLFKGYMDILAILDNKKDTTGLIFITQKELARSLGTSATNISKKIQQLIKHGAIKKVEDGAYKVLHADLLHTPYILVHRVYSLINTNPTIKDSYKEQASSLNVPLDDIFQAWAFINAVGKYK